MSIVQKSEKLSCSSCVLGLISIVINVTTLFMKLFSRLRELLADDSSTLSAKVKNTLINSKNRNKPVNTGIFGLLIR
jgi:Zn-dependent protease with chaperone function